MFDFKVFFFELFSVNGLSSSSVVVSEITSLDHELRNDSVEDGSLVSESLFTSAKSSEVLSSIWNDVSVKFDDNLTESLLAMQVESSRKTLGLLGLLGFLESLIRYVYKLKILQIN